MSRGFTVLHGDFRLDVLTPAVERVLIMRADQVMGRGYTAEADDELGTGALTRKALSHALRAQQKHLSAIERELQHACDDSMGRLEALDDSRLAALDRALCNTGSLSIAAMESLDRFRERQRGAPR